MNSGKVSVYFYSKFGYIIASYTTIKDSIIKTVMNPVITKKADVSAQELGETIIESMEKSRKALPVERLEVKDFKFWQISKIKGFSAFSKKFRCLKISEEGNTFEIVEWDRESDGSYGDPTGKKEPCQISSNATATQIGEAVLEYLSENLTIEVDDKLSFDTVNGNCVTYNRPSEKFLDIGDGHTDAYKIFSYEDNDKNYIAFIIDNNYPSFASEDIKERWEKIYGSLLEYQYKKIDKDILKLVVTAKSKSTEIKSYFYQDGEDLLEVLMEIDLENTSREFQNQISEEFKMITNSINIQ